MQAKTALHAGGTRSGLKTAVIAKINTETIMGSTEDGPEEKVPNAVTKQKRLLSKKMKRLIKNNFLLFQNFLNC